MKLNGQKRPGPKKLIDKMAVFEPNNNRFKELIKKQFAAQNIMQTTGMMLDSVEPGRVEISLPFDDKLTQHHGFHHAAITTMGMDNACGFAALSLMAENEEVLTVEFKTNFLRPASAKGFLFTGQVLKPGKSLYFCEGKAFGLDRDQQTLIATMSATMMATTIR